MGIVPQIFDEAKKNEIKNHFRARCKKETGEEGGDEVWEFYREYVKCNLHVVLSMSPAGNNLRVRCRNFPGLISQTTIDWFFTWPKEALTQVAEQQLADFPLKDELKKKSE